MRQTVRRFSAMLCGGIALVICWQSFASAGEPQVRAALAGLERWLGSSERGEGWHRFLKTDELRAQLERGAEADRSTVRKVLEQYEQEVPGIDLPRFAAVRGALQGWLDGLPLLGLAELPAAARTAIGQMRAIPEGQLEQDRARLQAALAKLEPHLAKGGVTESYRWKGFLRWDDLQAQLAAEGGADGKVLRAIERNFYQNKPGLEAEPFLTARAALRAYADHLIFSASDQSQALYAKNLEFLATSLESYAEQPGTVDAVDMGYALGWLERYGQAAEVVQAARRCYSSPNLMVELSENMLTTGFAMDIDERLGIRENILGTSVHGSARMTGRVGLDLIPAEHNAAMDVVLKGTTYSTNVGYNGPVKIYSNGLTGVTARKRLFLDAEGLTGNWARASCSTNTNIHTVKANNALVRRIAWNKVRQSKSQAESIASSRAAARVQQRIDAQVAELMERGNQVFEDQLLKPLLRRGGSPQEFDFRTMEESLHVTMLGATADQLGAPDAAPALDSGHDVAIQLHETFVGNMSEVMLGGVTVSDERMVEIAQDLLGRVPAELEITEDDDPWSITFADQRPVSVRFSEGKASVVIRGEKFTRGEQELNRTVEISASYQLERSANGLRLTRSGEVGIDLGRKTLSVSDTAMKTFLEKKFEELFKAEIVTEGITLSGRWAELGTLHPKQLRCEGGWLVLGWLAPPREVRTARRN